ncbi:MAG TPA: sigma 54-interacting transcriptional regulator [Candidatus Dormibacteraeota bacterium]|nr:sigma 54-interacting transcriptional regulator [Candidatus Dormibacteraeota bacterium]
MITVSTAKSGLELSADHDFVCGQSRAIEGPNAIVGQIAKTQIAVLIVGESGTGKEAYARLIHHLSEQGGFPLKKLSCTGLELEHLHPQLKALRPDIEPGQRTLFLDRIDELDMTSQNALLSLLPDGDGEEIGEKRLRLISSASQNLEVEVESGRFRHELFFRINGVRLHLPPLRERKEDIPAFFDYFLAKHASELNRQKPALSTDELELLTAYEWPGNIRELGNLARTMVALGSPKTIIANLGGSAGLATKNPMLAQTSLKDAARAASRRTERQLIIKALERTHWNRKRAAQQLQISYKSLLYKIKQTGVVEGTKASEP